MKKISIIFLIGLLIVAAFLTWLMFFNENSRLGFQQAAEFLQKDASQEVILVIDSGDGSPHAFKAEAKEGTTIFNLLKQETEKSNILLKIKSYDTGIMVDDIGGVKNGEGDKYWLYYVNGQTPMVSVDKKEIKPGDKIEFKFEKSPF